MKKHLILLLFIVAHTSLSANQLDSLLRVLDSAVKERPVYAATKELKIDSIKMLLPKTTSKQQQYILYDKLYTQYRNYNMDSALSVANKQYDLAEELNHEQTLYAAQMNIAEILARMGMYKEAIDIVEEFDRSKLKADHLPFLYHFYHSTYSLLLENSISQQQKKVYKDLTSLYKDSLLQINSPSTVSYNLILNGKLMEEGKYDQALDIITQCYNEYRYDESMMGTVAYGMASVYEYKGDTNAEKKYLAISAIADLRKARKTYIALRKLAIMLYKEGDLDRADSYIRCSMEDATFSKARFRALESLEMLPIITAAYNKKVEHEKSNLYKYLVLISILSLILIVSLLYIYKQLKNLAQAKRAMNILNKDLKQMNTSLNDLNTKLSESNLVKEEYIGSVFTLCSSYIDKLENYRINLNRKLVLKQYEEATRITGSVSLVNDELKDLFRNFDAIFLNIYPRFVEEFNALLQDGEQIIPKAGDILTPELRVFALVRLGVTDSSKIATFLHYSPQTVYNYNLKVRNKLIVTKEEFATALQHIG